MFSSIPNKSEIIIPTEPVKERVFDDKDDNIVQLQEKIKQNYDTLRNSLTELTDYLYQKEPPNEEIRSFLNKINETVKTKYAGNLTNGAIVNMTEEILAIKQKSTKIYERACEILTNQFNKKMEDLKNNKKCVLVYCGEWNEHVYYKRVLNYKTKFEHWVEYHSIDSLAINNFIQMLRKKGYHVSIEYKNDAKVDVDEYYVCNNETINIYIYI